MQVVDPEFSESLLSKVTNTQNINGPAYKGYVDQSLWKNSLAFARCYPKKGDRCELKSNKLCTVNKKKKYEEIFATYFLKIDPSSYCDSHCIESFYVFIRAYF
jgi:hypothetical protein